MSDLITLFFKRCAEALVRRAIKADLENKICRTVSF